MRKITFIDVYYLYLLVVYSYEMGLSAGSLFRFCIDTIFFNKLLLEKSFESWIQLWTVQGA